MADEFALCSPVPFAEGVQGVQFTEIVRGPLAKSLRPEPREVIFLRELLADPTGGAFDPRMMGEAVAALAYVDGP
jgi:hypothetical protein